MSISKTTMASIRFGYGFHPDQRPPRDAADLMDALRDGRSARPIFDVPTLPQRRDVILELARQRRSGAGQDAIKQSRRKMRRQAMQEGTERLLQRAISPHGFYERLAAFWADHFTVAGKNAVHIFSMPTFEIEALRPHIMGRFEDMLLAAVRHPVMLVYLDQTDSFGPNSEAGRRRGKGLNENLAREVLELHTVGVGADYTQADVHAFAKLLTGYAVHRPTVSFRFFRDRAEPGQKLIMGRRYGGARPSEQDAETFLRELARHPATARHMARKLAVHFVADQPDANLVDRIEQAWSRGNGDLPTVYAAVLDHPAAWSGFGAKIKQPMDLMVSTMRALGADKQMARDLGPRGSLSVIGALQKMNQKMFRAPGPDGWPEEAEAWITPQGLTARLNFASQVGQRVAKSSNPDPRLFADMCLRDALRPGTAFAVKGAPERWEGIAFVLASPEFNRR
jgi:uncharacterized protein (DUF1800 family)